MSSEWATTPAVHPSSGFVRVYPKPENVAGDIDFELQVRTDNPFYVGSDSLAVIQSSITGVLP